MEALRQVPRDLLCCSIEDTFLATSDAARAPTLGFGCGKSKASNGRPSADVDGYFEARLGGAASADRAFDAGIDFNHLMRMARSC